MKNLITKAFGIAGITALSFFPVKESCGQDNLEKTPEEIVGSMTDGLGRKLNKDPSQNTFATTRNSEGQIIKIENKYYSSNGSQWLINNIPIDSMTITRTFKYDSKDNLIKEIRFTDYHNTNLKNREEMFDLSKK